MKVSCPSCQSTLSIDDKKIPPGGARIKCPTCQNIFPVRPTPATSGAVPLPGASSTAATSIAPAPGLGSTAATSTVPLPGRAPPRQPAPAWQDEPTRADVPAPQPWQQASTQAVPLPGAGIPGATAIVAPPSNARLRPVAGTSTSPVPLPGLGSAPAQPTSVPDERTRVGGGASTSSAFDFDLGAGEPAPTRSRPSGAVPLPGSTFADAGATYAGPVPGAPGAVALPGAAAAGPVRASSRSGVIALPGAATSERSQPAGPTRIASQPSFTGIEPPPPADYSFEVPSEAPPPELAAPGSFDFGAPAGEPGAAAPGAFDFGAPAAGGPGLALESAQPPAPQPVGFGEVDLGGGGGGGFTGHGDLEFDPSAGAHPEPADEFEADLSAPLPAPAGPSGPVDGLEMLSFIDDQAREAGVKSEGPSSVRRFHIKRRSGKVFGPFEEAVIVKMLEEGQLLGNEEVSLDTESWQAVGSEPAFQTVIARLMEAPTRENAAGAQGGLQDERAKGPSMERLKQLYEGRMAAVAVVQGKEPVPFKKRLPLILGVAGAVAVLAVGISLGVGTPYGFFGLKVLFPAKVRPETREFTYLQDARNGFLADTWKGYRSAREQAAAALAIKEFPEARAVWCQAVFHLDRRYGKALQAELEQARSELVNVKLLGDKHPEVLKTLASEALSRHAPDEALAFINDALARDSDDRESLFLRAEVFSQKKQPQQARGELEQLVKKSDRHLGTARALHALGLISRAQNELADAEARFAAALAAEPTHLASALELAELAIINQRDATKGLPLVEKALTKEAADLLSTAEQGKALALKAEVLVLRGKMQDAVPVFEQALKVDPGNAFTQARLGRVYLELHDPDRAVALLAKAVASTPESLDYASGYLSALIAVGRMDDAKKVVQQVTARFPGNAMLAYLSGRVSDALDNPKEAEEAYKRALVSDPGIADAYLYLARLYMRFRRFGEARPQLEAGLQRSPDNAPLRMGMGELAFMERDLDRAEKEFKAAVDVDASLPEAHLGLSRVSLERGKLDLAEAQVERALDINARITGGKLQQGLVLWRLGRLDDAIAVLEKARDDEPRNLQVRVTLGAVAFEKGDLDGALKYLNTALVAEPGHPDGNFYLARVQDAQRNYTQAIEAMKRALDFNGTNPVYHYWMGRIYADAKKTEDAVSEWKAALQLDDDYADALEALGKVYFERADYKRAVKNYELALKADPTRASVRLEIGDAQMKLDDWDGAIASYSKALDADPDLRSAYFQLGLAYEEKKLPKKAIEQYLKAVKADARNADAWRQLGWLYKTTGKRKDASGAFQKYLAIKPDAEDHKQIEDELEFMKQGASP
jgi:cellulose synthase operon protein C